MKRTFFRKPVKRKRAIRTSTEPSEFQICVALNDYMRANYPVLYSQGLFFAIPNGEYRDPRTASKLKATGVIKGVSDYALIQESGGYRMLWLEVKTMTGRPSDDQLAWLAGVRSQGHAGIVTYGLAETKAVVKAWMRGDANDIIWMQGSDKKGERNKAYKSRGESAPQFER